jgi:hypothetical protein
MNSNKVSSTNAPEGASQSVAEGAASESDNERNNVEHLPGVRVSGQPQGGAVENARKRDE